MRPTPESVRILITEDDEVSGPLMIEQMRARGFAMRWCTNGACCLESLRPGTAEPIDLLILDLRLPDMRGEEVIHELLSRPLSLRLRIIVISAHLAHGEEKAFVRQLDPAAQAMVSSVLVKPFDMTALEQAIHQALSERG